MVHVEDIPEFLYWLMEYDMVDEAQELVRRGGRGWSWEAYRTAAEEFYA
jgi:hypothetical protein